jgi:coenzyme F420-0:L-glutamate ligase / coenzyme F420-1:gamma-L-glutamate ligase
LRIGTRIELLALDGVPDIRPGDDLAQIVVDSLRQSGFALRNGDILALAQKVVSKAENRYVRLDCEPSARAREVAAVCGKDPRLVEIILRESKEVLRVVPGLLIVEDHRGLVLANAGVDRSNVDQAGSGLERVLLLPIDPDASATRIRSQLKALTGAEIGVLINDSIGRAWRLGTVGTAIGVSGLPGLLDRRGEPDLQGRRLEITEVGIADELAAAASVLMGQAAEGTPAVLIRGVFWPRREGTARELLRARTLDLFR